MTEIQIKLQKVRELMDRHEAKGVRLKSVDWFAWMTGGGDSSVIFSAEVGIAEVFITRDRAFIMTNAIESERLTIEEVSNEFEVLNFPWRNALAADEFILSHAPTRDILCDRPTGQERALPDPFKMLKLTLTMHEFARYQKLGTDAAHAATQALTQVKPEMTEWELAGLAAKELWSRGIHPLLTLVGGEGRISRYRHPVATSSKIGDHAMLVICGRRQGLFANLTRHVYFRKLRDDEARRACDVALVEEEAFNATEELNSLEQIFARIKAKYSSLGYSEEIFLHHQGGPTGYLSREAIAGSNGNSSMWQTTARMAFAWNPSLSGAKIEDTVYLGDDQNLKILTCDPQWPTIEIGDRLRPDIWIRN
jgi:Xaa-Pro aminopeptidase